MEVQEQLGPCLAKLFREQKYLGHREIDGERDKNSFSIWFLNSPLLAGCHTLSVPL